MSYSQIYVRLNDSFGRKFLLAKNYGFNLQQRMVSRGRGIIEYLYDNREYANILTLRDHLDELGRIMEINWDYHTVEIADDIIQNYIDNRKKETFKEFVFDNQDSGDGQLFIDFQADFKRKNKNGDPKCIIKYGFFINYDKEDEDEIVKDDENYRAVYGPDEFMQMSYSPDPENYNYREWRTRQFFAHCLKFTERNISYIEKHAKRMTEVEALEFMKYDYTKDLGAYYKL